MMVLVCGMEKRGEETRRMSGGTLGVTLITGGAGSSISWEILVGTYQPTLGKVPRT